MTPVKRDLKVSKRVVKQLSDSAIKKNPLRALVELITNSDDSYRRLEHKGLSTSGSIVIEVNRKRSNSVLRVIDEAEGFDEKTMDERVGGFGSDTSGLTDGLDVRGYFGRGLKEAILGLGHGRVTSVKDNLLYECTLDDKALFERQDPVRTNRSRRKELSKLGIIRDGTIVEITASRDGVKVPQIDTFVQQLGRYYSLRDINASTKRSVSIVECNDRGVRKKPIKLEYAVPLGKEMVNKKGVQVEGDSGAKLDIRIFKANEPLTQSGPSSEAGILIKGKTAIHANELFSFDNNPYAQRIFGSVRCNYIDELIKKDEQVLSDRRDGLDLKHPFCISLKKTVEKEIEVVVKEIKKEEENKKKKIENEKTRQRFLKAVEKINQIASAELGEEGEGRKETKDGKKETPPPNGFDFMPEFYHVIAGQRSTLTLKAVVPWLLKDGSIINLECDNENIRLEQTKFNVRQTDEIVDGIIKFNPVVYGKRVGDDAVITARSGNYKAEAIVKVVAKISRKGKKKKKGQESKGLINGIEYDPTLGPMVRHYFERENNTVKISSKHPSVKAYLGPNGEGQDELHCQVLIAELVTDSICREMARRKAESGNLMILGERMDAINKEHNELINKYAHVIHTCLVSTAARRIN